MAVIVMLQSDAKWDNFQFCSDYWEVSACRDGKLLCEEPEAIFTYLKRMQAWQAFLQALRKRRKSQKFLISGPSSES